MSPLGWLLALEGALGLIGALGMAYLQIPPGLETPLFLQAAAALILLAALFGLEALLARSFPASYRATRELLAAALSALPKPWRPALALASALAEEAFFRGLLVGGLARLFPPPLAVLFGALAFALFHPVPDRRAWVYPLFALFAGVLFGAAFLATGSLVPSTLAHLALNAWALLGPGGPPSPGDRYLGKRRLGSMFQKIQVPEWGEKIRVENGKLVVPDHPIVAFIEGDGTGPDIWNAAQPVFDAAVEKAYGGRRKIAWMEVYAGEKANRVYGEEVWLPEETIEAIREYLVAIKGPLTTPVGGGIRSINVAIRQRLDLYACVRPVRYFEGVPSPVKHPELVDMVVFRENTEDIYAGIEWPAGSEGQKKLLEFLKDEFPEEYKKIRFPETSGIGLKPISEEGTKRLVEAAIRYAIAERRKSVTLVHKGNIMKFTEGAFRNWGYEVAREKFGAKPLDGGPWHVVKHPETGEEIVIKDVIADNFLQQILTRPAEYDVIATPNLNGDYISDALAAQVGGIGIAPGANINYQTGHAVFEATHGTAPKYAGQDKVNPSSVILSGVMMLQYMGWREAADLIVRAMEATIKEGLVTYDFHRLMAAEGREAKLLKTSEFGQALIERM